MSVTPVWVPRLCQVSTKARGSPEAGVTNACELTRGSWELNSGPLQEQPMLLPDEPSQQLTPTLSKNLYFSWLGTNPGSHTSQRLSPSHPPVSHDSLNCRSCHFFSSSPSSHFLFWFALRLALM